MLYTFSDAFKPWNIFPAKRRINKRLKAEIAY